MDIVVKGYVSLGVPRKNIITIKDAKTTREVTEILHNIGNDAKDDFDEYGRNTLFLFYYAGHGLTVGGYAAGVVNVDNPNKC